MNKVLIKTRLISFAYGGGTLLLLALIAVLSSPEFQALVSEHAGTGFFGTVAVLLLMELVKHLRNLHVLKGQDYGGEEEKKKRIILI